MPCLVDCKNVNQVARRFKKFVGRLISQHQAAKERGSLGFSAAHRPGKVKQSGSGAPLQLLFVL